MQAPTGAHPVHSAPRRFCGNHVEDASMTEEHPKPTGDNGPRRELYWDSVKSIAERAAAVAAKAIADSKEPYADWREEISTQVGQTNWVSKASWAIDVLRFSDNPGAYYELFLDCAPDSSSPSLRELTYCAMEYDVFSLSPDIDALTGADSPAESAPERAAIFSPCGSVLCVPCHNGTADSPLPKGNRYPVVCDSCGAPAMISRSDVSLCQQWARAVGGTTDQTGGMTVGASVIIGDRILTFWANGDPALAIEAHRMADYINGEEDPIIAVETDSMDHAVRFSQAEVERMRWRQKQPDTPIGQGDACQTFADAIGCSVEHTGGGCLAAVHYGQNHVIVFTWEAAESGECTVGVYTIDDWNDGAADDPVAIMDGTIGEGIAFAQKWIRETT